MKGRFSRPSTDRPTSNGLDEVIGPRGSCTRPVDRLPVISQRTERFDFLAVLQKLGQGGWAKCNSSALVKMKLSHGFLHLTPSSLNPVFIGHRLCTRLQPSGSALSGKLRTGGSRLKWGVGGGLEETELRGAGQDKVCGALCLERSPG